MQWPCEPINFGAAALTSPIEGWGIIGTNVGTALKSFMQKLSVPTIAFTVYVSGNAQEKEVTSRLRKIVQKVFPGSHSMRVVDIRRNAKEAEEARISFVPTVLIHSEGTIKRVVGDLGELEWVLEIMKGIRED